MSIPRFLHNTDHPGPDHAFLGSQAGLELGNGNASGLSMYGAMYARIRLDTDEGPKTFEGLKPAYSIRPTLNFYDRGGEKQEYYEYGLVRRFWESMVYFELRS